MRAHSLVPHILLRPISIRALIAVILGWFALSHLLLWRFLDIAPHWAYVPAVAAVMGGTIFLARAPLPRNTHAGAAPSTPHNPILATLLLYIAVAAILFILGGEGRLFYANVDWQVREAVLRDMAVHPWPFVYTVREVPDVLRAPLGMYFFPALAFKAFGPGGWGPMAADWALLLQNATLTGTILAFASTLFATTRERAVALLIFLVFSGADIIGVTFGGLHYDHIENWAGIQYSSTVTLAFWVPNHAIPGWAGAVAFLLWQRGRIPLAAFLALIPLATLWSPLAAIGMLPFAALAGVSALKYRNLKASDVLLPALCALFIIPTLLYLSAAGDDVGFRLYPLHPVQYGTFLTLEVVPFLLPLLFLRKRLGLDWPALLTVIAVLFLAPLIQIGFSTDFEMRATIPALMLLTLWTAQALNLRWTREDRHWQLWLVMVLAIGSVTGAKEIARAFAHPPSPRVVCSFFKAGDQEFERYPKGTYVAPWPKMPALVRPANPTHASAVEPAKCWDSPWYKPNSV